MFRPRIIPVLLLQNNSLVKSQRFTDFRYIGDPIHTVKIFNDLQVNELIFLDINATIEKRCISIDLIKTIGEEASMPFAVGGGIRTIENIKKIIANGAEKVVIGSYAAEKPDFIKEASERFGSSAISVCIDVKKNFFGKKYTWTRNGKKSTGITPETFAKLIEENGAGEIIIQSIEKDGLMTGYDIDLIKKISSSVTIPVIALGGAGNLSHLKDAYLNGLASGLAAGSLFVFQGRKHGVLINYPDKNELKFDT